MTATNDASRTGPGARFESLFVRRSILFWLLGVVALASFQFFVNSEDWRRAGIAGTDGQAYYAFVRSAVVDGDLDFQNEFYEHNYNRHGFQTPDFFPRSPITGRIFNRFPIGFSIFLAPFFLLAHCLSIAGTALGVGAVQPDGYTLLYQLMAPVGTIFYAALAYLSTERLLRRRFSPVVSAFVVFTLFLSHQGAFNVVQFWCNPHLHSLLVFNGMLVLAFRVEDGRASWRVWAGLGATVGLLGLLRTELLVVALFPALLWIWDWRRSGSGSNGGAASPASTRFFQGLVAAGVAALVFLPQIVVWRLMWGEWFHVAMNNPAEGFNWTRPVLLRVLFSTRHGLFYWSPILLLGLAGLLWFAVRERRAAIVRLALIQLAALWYLYACWKIWWMGYSFGARQFVVAGSLFALGLAFLVERFSSRRRLLISLAVGFIGWNTIMLWLYLNGHIPRDEGFEPWLPFVRVYEKAKELLP